MVSAGPPSHSPVTASDLELLDMLTNMSTNSTFPHMSLQPRFTSAVAHAHAQQHPTTPSAAVDDASNDLRRKPLDTLQALRRPPIDPIILAASLSSGPHVTRHHFHHSFAGRADERKSHQMPASERRERLRKLELENQQRRAGLLPRGGDQATPGPSHSTSVAAAASLRPRRKTVTQVSVLTGQGKYASCDLGTDEELEVDGQSSQAQEESEEELAIRLEEERVKYTSSQAPRSVRLQKHAELRDQIIASQRGEAVTGQEEKAAAVASAAVEDVRTPPPPPKASNPSEQIGAALNERRALVDGVGASATLDPSATSTARLPASPSLAPATAAPPTSVTPIARGALSSIVRPPPISVRCYARTRIPTPHGEIFCHLYRNNHDAKEHLALVVDPSQNDEASMQLNEDGRPTKLKGTLRSRTLDEKWGEEETEMERIVRGAYVGRLGPSFQMASEAIPRRRNRNGQIEVDVADEDEVPALVRIHSECYTGETIGSQRCDCGEQLDEAIRLIHQSGTEGHPPRGVVVYLRQEGRGIGLLDKLMAYNLQDMGHDTVSANILLGHLADARKYDVASAILRDLGISQCRLLTNNPEKMEALEAEGVRVCQRVAMIPRAWRVSKRHRHKRRTARAKAKKSSVNAMAAVAERDGGRGSSSSSSKQAKKRDGSTASSTTTTKTKTNKTKGRSIKDPKRRLKVEENLEASIISQAASNATTDEEEEEEDAEELRASALGARHQASDNEVEVEDFDEQDDGHEAFSDEEDEGGVDLDSEEEDEDDEEEEEEEEDGDSDSSADSYVEHVLRRSGATMLGATVTRGVELERYLRTKVEKMGHMLDLPPSGPATATSDEGHGRHPNRSAKPPTELL